MLHLQFRSVMLDLDGFRFGLKSVVSLLDETFKIKFFKFLLWLLLHVRRSINIISIVGGLRW
jgi:hypothetical protein